MRKIYVVFGLVLLSALFYAFSCIESDGYSLGDFRVDIATVQPNGDGSFSLTLDDDVRLWPAASDVSFAPKQNQRVFVNYTVLSGAQNGYDHYIKINDIWNILTKPVTTLTAANRDSIGNDPVKINAIWVGNDYLNVDFMFNYGGVRPHAINMILNPLRESPSSSPNAIELEFRHNAYASANTRLYEGFVCFDLKPFQTTAADSVELSVKVADWDGEKTYNVVYRYNEAALRNIQTKTPIPVISSNEYY